MKKTKLLRWLSLTLLLLLSACSVKAEAPIKPLTLMVASDLHYLAPELTDLGPNFMTMVQDGAGKPRMKAKRSWMPSSPRCYRNIPMP